MRLVGACDGFFKLQRPAEELIQALPEHERPSLEAQVQRITSKYSELSKKYHEEIRHFVASLETAMRSCDLYKKRAFGSKFDRVDMKPRLLPASH